jgi:hypothetical protein
MYGRMSYKDAIDKAEHLIALGQQEVWISADGAPWDRASTVVASGCYRLDGPMGARIQAKESGLTLQWDVDFEGKDASGEPVAMFDAPRLREVMIKLPPPAREQFAALLEKEVMPGLQKRAKEWLGYYSKALDSEQCVSALINFAKSEPA